MEHKGTIRLETERLILRRFTMEDVEPSYKNWTSDVDTTRYVTWNTHTDVGMTHGLLEYWIKNYEDIGVYQWAIELKETGDVMGTVLVSHKSTYLHCAHLGYCLGSKFWHKGYATEALKRVIKFLFEEVGFIRIEARHDVENYRSGEVMKKCGMKFEGTLRKYDKNKKNEMIDSNLYAIIDDDYYGK